MLGWDGDGAGREGVDEAPCAITQLCMSSTSLILFRFHLTQAISEHLWVCGFQRRLRSFSGILYNFPVGKNQYWRSRAKPASGFLQKNKIKSRGEVCGCVWSRIWSIKGIFQPRWLLWVNAGAGSSPEHSRLFLLNPTGNPSLGNGGSEAEGMHGIWDCSSPGNAAVGSPPQQPPEELGVSPEPPF